VSDSETERDDDVSDRNPISCPRCEQQLDFVGTKQLHEGTNWGVLGELGELFVKRERFDVYLCPRCGRVEFFVDGIGEEFRPR
jgi:ribosomal protein S27AE